MAATTAEAEIRPQPGPQITALQSKADILIYGGQAGGGKRLRIDEPIATPDGWTCMGRIKPGDIVFDADGFPTTVTGVSAIVTPPEAWRLIFDDGSHIECDPEHLWLTLTDKDRDRLLRSSPEWMAKRRASRPSRANGNRSKAFTAAIAARNSRLAAMSADIPDRRGSTRTTAEIVLSLKAKGCRTNHSITNADPIQCPEAELPLRPYTLGAWLGDGTSCRGEITGIDREVWETIESEGYTVTHSERDKQRHGILKIVGMLRSLNVLRNKHIPQLYLRSSIVQRIELLRGLCDTDGTVTNKGSIEFTTTCRAIRDGFIELLASLGIKPSCREGIAKLNGKAISKKWRIQFWTEIECFRITRKLNRQKTSGFRGCHSQRYIVAAEPCTTTPMRCITVDSPSRTYLAGRLMIPTHNTWFLTAEPLRRVHNGGFRAVIFRRTYPQIMGQGGLWEEANALYRPQGGKMREGDKLDATFPSGATIAFCHLQHEKTKYEYQGHQICCEVGTRVKTVKGLIAVERLRAGDLVETLSGPQRILAVQKPRSAQCVTARVGGNVQVHTTSHAMLTTQGWQSYDDMCGESLLSSTSAPTLFGTSCKSEQRPYGKSCVPVRCVDSSTGHPARVLELTPQLADHQQPSETCACDLQSAPEIDSEASGGDSQEPTRLPLLTCRALLFAPSQPLSGLSCAPHSSGNAISDDQHDSLPEDCSDHCLSSLRQHDGQLHRAPEADRFHLLQRADAERRTPTDSLLDASDSTPTHSRPLQQYAHPYTKEVLGSLCRVVECDCELEPCGERLVVDITVANVSHYITESGIINKNCYLGFDELTHFTQSQFFYLVSRNRSTCGIRPYIRATCNPDAGSWVATFIEWWIGDDGLPIAERSGKLRYFVRDDQDNLTWSDSKQELIDQFPQYTAEQILSVTFVPATLDDNPALTRKDPGYKAKLMAMPRIERLRLLGGNWKVSEGSLIELEWFKRYQTHPDGSIEFPHIGLTFKLPPNKFRRIATIDTAGTSKEKAAEQRGDPPSWSVCGIWDVLPSYLTIDHGSKLVLTELLFLRHVWRAQVDWNQLKAQIPPVLSTWNVQRTFIENAHYGKPLVAELRGFQTELIGPTISGMDDSSRGAKLERAVASGMLSRVELGKIFIPDDSPPWLAAYIREMTVWTGLPKETADQVDMTSYASYVTRGTSNGRWGGVLAN